MRARSTEFRVTIISLTRVQARVKAGTNATENGFDGFWYRSEGMKAPKNRGIFAFVIFFRRQLFGWRLVAAEKLLGATPNDVLLAPIGRFMHGFGNLLAYVSECVSAARICWRRRRLLLLSATSNPMCRVLKACAFAFFFLFAPFIILIILKLFVYAYSPFDPLYLTP